MMTHITLTELALVAGTRAAAGIGLGLLLGDRLTREQRRAAGWALFAFGALTTIPLAFEVFGRRRRRRSTRRFEGDSRNERSLSAGALSDKIRPPVEAG